MGIPAAKNKSGCVDWDWFKVEKRISPLRCAPVEMTILSLANASGGAAYS